MGKIVMITDVVTINVLVASAIWIRVPLLVLGIVIREWLMTVLTLLSAAAFR